MRYLFFLFLLMAGACSPLVESVEVPAEVVLLPAVADLDPGWNSLAPGSGTRCALDTEYRFFARAADPDRVLIHLQGGGACSTGRNCDPESEPTYSRDVDETDNPARRPTGIFDLQNPANPVADYSLVLIPYCTGDVHLGNRNTTYWIEPEDSDGYEVPIRHNGYVNAMAVLDWVFANFQAPNEVVVTGSSAGSIPAPFYGQIVAQHYPDARVVALGDAAGSYRRQEAANPNQLINAWRILDVVKRHPGYEEMTREQFGFESLYIVAGRQRPEMRLFQFDAAHDAVQAFFSANAGAEDPDPAPMLAANRAAIRGALDNFAGFTAGGAEHTVLRRSEFYTYEVGGHLFRDWFAAAAAGEPVPDIECTDCSWLELHYQPTDAALVAGALDVMASESAWGPDEGGPCPAGDDRFSLRCALAEAGRRTGTTVIGSAAATAVTAEVLWRAPRGGVDLIRFNNAEQTGFADIRSVLHTVAERIAGHGHD